MNIIINKLDIPCDIKFNINNFVYDRLGYTYEDIKKIQEYKKNNKFQMQRITTELWRWKEKDVSIQFLRGSVYSYVGMFKNIFEERDAMLEAIENNVFAEKDHDELKNNYKNMTG